MKAIKKYYPYLFALGPVLPATLLGELVKNSLNPVNIVMFYLLAVVVAAVRWGRGPAVAASFVSVIVFDFFLVKPYLTLGVDDIQYLFTFAVLLIVGLIVSEFSSKVREQVIQRQTEKLHSALLSSISHDLKTPLVSITGVLTTILDSGTRLSPRQEKELLENARGEAGRLERIVSNLLDITRMESGVLRLNKMPCDLADLIGVCLEQVKGGISSREIKINIPSGAPEVPVDFQVILKAFVNILDNALKYSPSGTPVEISVLYDRSVARMEIRDYGAGITAEDKKKVFEKFFRGDSCRNVPGTGLGLCIARGIIEAHGGSLGVRDPAGKGSCFIVELPLE